MLKQQSPFFALLFVNIVMVLLYKGDPASADHIRSFDSASVASSRNLTEHELVQQFTFGDAKAHGRQKHHQHIAELASANLTQGALPSTKNPEVIGTASCEVCIVNPEDPLCEYGIDNIRLSRTYQGSGHRIRRMLAKADQGQPIRIGVSLL